jgi:heme-degrading monooxygenase HmoA
MTMFAHLVLFKIGTGNRKTAEEMADKFAGIYAECPNCKQVTFLGDDENGEYGSISLWDSEAALAAYQEQAGPQLGAALQDVALGPPAIRKFEVYEPKV